MEKIRGVMVTYAAGRASAFPIATVAATAGLAFAACHLVGIEGSACTWC